MAMLDLYKDQIAAICHVNYHYRNSSNNDMNLVKKYADKYHIPFYVYIVDKKVYLKKFNFENWARKTRYDFFNKIAHKLDIFDIIIAHNQDDNLETALMQKNKHSKTLYLGIKKHSKYKDLKIYRPLINKTKQSLIDYCNKNNIDFVIDETNADIKYTRNKIRKDLQTKSNDYLNNLLNEINSYNFQHKNLLKKSKAYFNEWKQSKFSLNLFKSLNNEYQIQVIYLLLTSLNSKRINAHKINEIIKFINSPKGNISYRINNNTQLYKKNKYLYIKVI